MPSSTLSVKSSPSTVSELKEEMGSLKSEYAVNGVIGFCSEGLGWLLLGNEFRVEIQSVMQL